MSASPTIATSESDANLRDFVLWLLTACGCECTCDESSIVVDDVPESLQPKIGGNRSLRLRFSATGSEDLITADSPIVRSLADCLGTTQIVGRATPANQPERVRDVAQRLFDQYTIDGGTVHLSGCTLEDRPILRITYLARSATVGSESRLRHRFVSLTGEPLETSVVEHLGLAQLGPLTGSIPMTDDQCTRWRHIGEAVVTDALLAENVDLLLTTVVWCKYAEGKLAFAIDDATASLAFSGWAQQFVDGSIKPPALTHASFPQGSRHLAVTDDGEIVPFEAIGICSESGKRTTLDDLETCDATGEHALPEFLTSCPTSGVRVLSKVLVTCKMCQQSVSPAACEEQLCSACRSLASVSKDDPRMARLLGEYPKLDRWSRWKFAETATAYVLVASSLAKRLLVVVDKNDLAVLRLAKGSRFNKKWAEASELDRGANLR